MNPELRILLLEDNALDADLIARELTAANLRFTLQRVWTEADFRSALCRHSCDLVLADYSLPMFDGMEALRIARAERPDLPFVFVSGSLGEELAIETLLLGATDYVLKHHLCRLVPAVRRAMREVTNAAERAAADAALREKATLLDKANDAIYVCDVAGTVRYWNAGAQRLFGWSSAEALGRNVSFLGATADGTDAWQVLRQNGCWIGEQTGTNRDGKQLKFLTRLTMVAGDQDRPASVFAISTDVTEMKQLQEQLFHAQRMESIGLLAGGIAHDLNNILAPIMMIVPMLRTEIKSAANQALLDTMERGCQRGADIIRQILTFSRGLSGERVPVQTRHLLEEVASIISETFPKSIKLDARIPRDLWLVEGNPSNLEQILINLAVNARDAMPDGGTLLLSAENVVLDEAFTKTVPESKPGPHLCWIVADTGIGIPADNLTRIFDPFFSTKPAGQGTGLGLSTVASIVRSHGGFFRVKSRPGEGATFGIYLPAAPGVENQTPTSDIRLPAGDGTYVLLVDDEESVRRAMQRAFELCGFRVLTATDGQHALDVIEQSPGPIGLVITDLVMPRMDGLAFVKAIRERAYPTRIIVASGTVDEKHAAALRSLAVDQILEKPFSSDALARAVLAAGAPPGSTIGIGCLP
jgi:PAS domain S-box-containing protein